MAECQNSKAVHVFVAVVTITKATRGCRTTGVAAVVDIKAQLRIAFGGVDAIGRRSVIQLRRRFVRRFFRWEDTGVESFDGR